MRSTTILDSARTSNMKITPPSALAAWAVSTAWLVLFLVLERLDPYWGEELVDWIQIASLLVASALFPFFKKWFADWLSRRSG